MIITAIPSAKECPDKGTHDIQRVVYYVANYVDNTEKKADIPVIHNLQSSSIPEIAEEFIQNYKHCKPRQGGKLYHHEVIAFKPEDNEKLSDNDLRNIANKYLRERAKNAMGYANVHRDKDHIHIHFVLSPNLIGSNKRLRMSQKEFAQMQHNFEKYVNTKYPQLTNSKFYGETKNHNIDISLRKQRENGLLRRVNNEIKNTFTTEDKSQPRDVKRDKPYLTNKQKIGEEVREALRSSIHREEFVRLLKEKKLYYFNRGRSSQGVICGNYKYRFKTLNVDQEVIYREYVWGYNNTQYTQFSLLHDKIPRLLEESKNKKDFISLLKKEGIKFHKGKSKKEWVSAWDITTQLTKTALHGSVPRLRRETMNIPEIEINGQHFSFDELGCTAEFRRWEYLWKSQEKSVELGKKYKEKKHDPNKLYAVKKKLERVFLYNSFVDIQKHLKLEGISIAGTCEENYRIHYENEWFSLKNNGLDFKNYVKYFGLSAQKNRRRWVDTQAQKAQLRYNLKYMPQGELNDIGSKMGKCEDYKNMIKQSNQNISESQNIEKTPTLNTGNIQDMSSNGVGQGLGKSVGGAVGTVGGIVANVAGNLAEQVIKEAEKLKDYAVDELHKGVDETRDVIAEVGQNVLGGTSNSEKHHQGESTEQERMSKTNSSQELSEDEKNQEFYLQELAKKREIDKRNKEQAQQHGSKEQNKGYDI